MAYFENTPAYLMHASIYTLLVTTSRIEEEKMKTTQSNKQSYAYRILYLRNGKMEMTLDDRSYIMDRGDICILCPGTVYKTIPVTTFQVANFWFSFGEDLSAQFPQIETQMMQEQEFEDCSAFKEPFVLAGRSDITKFLDMMIDESLSNLPFRKSHCNHLLGLVLNTIVRIQEQTAAQIHLSDMMRKICIYIDDHITETISISKLAQAFSYHPTYINTLFRRYFGQTAHEYILSRKIDCVTNMLTTTDLPIGEIALSYGFSDSSHLARLYRKYTGMSPSEVKKFERND